MSAEGKIFAINFSSRPHDHPWVCTAQNVEEPSFFFPISMVIWHAGCLGTYLGTSYNLFFLQAFDLACSLTPLCYVLGTNCRPLPLHTNPRDDTTEPGNSVEGD